MADHRQTEMPPARKPEGVVERAARALKDMVQGRRLPLADFELLKLGGYVAGTRALPALTARGKHLLQARRTPTDAPSQGEGLDAQAFQLPDVLSRLAMPRKGEASLLQPCDVAAGARFHADLERAGMRQRVSQNWSLASLTIATGPTAHGGRHEPVAMLDAKARVNRACSAIGPDFSGLLIDLCLFDHSLAQLEGTRQWPARSGKLAIALGLKALARHYGLDRAATGRRTGAQAG
jgi:hypothetical protein